MGVAAVALCIWYYNSLPSGYEARYTQPRVNRSSSSPSSYLPTHSSARSRVNAQVERLASIVAIRAPITGTHREGTTTIHDHVLDRSKFEASEIALIADSIFSELANEPDEDGFIASSYFNARIMAVSIDAVNNVSRGRTIIGDIEELDKLARDRKVRKWLINSRFAKDFSDLRQRLRRYSLIYQPGMATSDLEHMIDTEKAKISHLDQRLSELQRTNTDSYNAMVPEFNEQVRTFNTSLKNYRFQHTAEVKLDYAFNKCLDPNILMGKFQNVSLTAHAAEIEAIPDK